MTYKEALAALIAEMEKRDQDIKAGKIPGMEDIKPWKQDKAAMRRIRKAARKMADE